MWAAESTPRAPPVRAPLRRAKDEPIATNDDLDSLEARRQTIYDFASGDLMNNIAAIIASLERAPSIVVPLAREVPQAILKRRPKPGKWSAHEHACHLAAVHPLMLSRLDLMLAETNPRIRPYLPHLDDDDGALLTVDLAAAMDRFAGDRQGLVQRLKALSNEDWQRTAQHGEYTHYSIFIMFRHLAMHDMFHAYRIEELLLKNDWE
jgi:hypothetical protein